MNSYHVDWVGARSAGAATIIVISFIKTAFLRLTGVTFYLVVGTSVAAFLRHEADFGISSRNLAWSGPP